MNFYWKKCPDLPICDISNSFIFPIFILPLNLIVFSNIETYYSHDTIKELDKSTYRLPSGTEADLLGIVCEPGIPPYKLSLKVGCITIIMRNLSIEKGLVKNA
jgi:hypothetical protein